MTRYAASFITSIVILLFDLKKSKTSIQFCVRFDYRNIVIAAKKVLTKHLMVILDLFYVRKHLKRRNSCVHIPVLVKNMLIRNVKSYKLKKERNTGVLQF